MGAESGPERDVNGGQKSVNADLHGQLRGVIEGDGNSQSKGKALERIARENGMEVKEVQEETEAVIAEMMREIDGESIPDTEKFAKLTELYQKQPVLSKRTSTSMRNQAYSTPAPLAWLLGKRIGIQNGKQIYEPTAGTGLLVATAPRNLTIVNELDKKRLSILERQGHAFVHNNDATKWKPTQQADRVIMNPPFGGAEEKEIDGYRIGKLDHQIALKA